MIALASGLMAEHHVPHPKLFAVVFGLAVNLLATTRRRPAPDKQA